MSRKRRRHKINKSKFKSAVCSKCGLCSKGINPKFCFGFLYKKNPGKFMGNVLPKVLSQNTYLAEVMSLDPKSISTSMIAMSIFRAVYCTSGLCVGCDQEVSKVSNCIVQFKTQETQNPTYKMIQQTFGPKLTKKQRKALKKAKRAEAKKKHKPKVTVFMSDNEEFRAEVKRLLENNHKQPDKD